ncbi:hypothetical protein DFS34DRAFT_487054 [Phlyctochytrium arcticum]|nr:hypothetical protein DFS34DRAFT_487054 [Phlyctochytrium arcticum]
MMEKHLGRKLAPTEYINHINLDKSDNQISNLQIVTLQQNNQWQSKNSTNTSGYKGVAWHKEKSKWQASIRVNQKRKHLGYFSSKEAAALAYNRAAEEANGNGGLYMLNSVSSNL